MKTKIFNFILTGAFIISAVHCSYDIDELLEVFPSAGSFSNDDANVAPFHNYTEQEKELVHNNIGSDFYEGIFNDINFTTFVILPERMEIAVRIEIAMKLDIRYYYLPYTISFDGPPLLIIDGEMGHFEIPIIFKANSFTDVESLTSADMKTHLVKT